MKYCGTIILAVLFASLALSEDFKTVSGEVYKDATNAASRVEGDGIVLKTEKGIFKVYFAELPQGGSGTVSLGETGAATRAFLQPLGGRRSGCSGKNHRFRSSRSSPASRLLWVISVLDDSQQGNQEAHRDEERVIVRAHEFTVNLIM